MEVSNAPKMIDYRTYDIPPRKIVRESFYDAKSL